MRRFFLMYKTCARDEHGFFLPGIFFYRGSPVKIPGKSFVTFYRGFLPGIFLVLPGIFLHKEIRCKAYELCLDKIPHESNQTGQKHNNCSKKLSPGRLSSPRRCSQNFYRHNTQVLKQFGFKRTLTIPFCYCFLHKTGFTGDFSKNPL